jgi:arsenate reductase (glutaredoxin)
MQVQIFGTKKSSETRAALRFFAERRIKTHFVDLTERAASPRELERFIQKFGLDAIIDREGKRYKELGLTHSHLTPNRWLDKLADEPLLLRMPLVRYENKLTVGEAVAEWKTWS